MYQEETVNETKNKQGFMFAMLGVIAVLVVLVVAGIALLAGRTEKYRSLVVFESFGDAKLYRNEKTLDMYDGMKLRSGDYVSIGENSYVRMCFDDDKYVYLEGRALMKLTVDGNKKNSRTIVNLELGTMVTEIEKKLSDKSVYEINSPNTTMAIRGTVTVSEVRYDLTQGDALPDGIDEAQVQNYLIQQKAAPQEKPEYAAVIEELFKTGTTAKVSSYVQEGKVELTVFEKKADGAGTTIAATALPLEAGKGLSSNVTDMVSAEVLSMLEVKQDGTIAVKAEAEGSELLKDVTVQSERKQVSDVQELQTSLEGGQVTEMENLDEVQLRIDLEKEKITDQTVMMWENAIADLMEASGIAPTSAPTEPSKIISDAKAEFTYSLTEKGHVRLEDLKDKSVTEIVIPGQIDGKWVVRAADATLRGCDNVTMIRLEENVNPNTFLLPELLRSAVTCNNLREIRVPGSYEEYLTQIKLDQSSGLTVTKEGEEIVIRLQTNLIFLAPQLMEKMEEYEQLIK